MADDIALLHKLRGRFRRSASERLFQSVVAGITLVIIPSALLAALFHGGLPTWPFSTDEIVCAILAVGSFSLGLVLWRSADTEYEFTGDEIICRRADQIQWRLPIKSITRTRVEVLPRSGTRIWHLRAGDVTRRLVEIKSVSEYLSREIES